MVREDVNMGGAGGEDKEDGERGHQDEERKGERGEEFSRVKPAIALQRLRRTSPGLLRAAV